jgi:hypothetical protein
MSHVEALTERIRAQPLHDMLWSGLAPASGLCGLCRGSGHLMCYQDGNREFWECPACGGVGARALFGKPTIKMRNIK